MEESKKDKWNAYQREYSKNQGVIIFTAQKERMEELKNELKENNVTLNELIRAAVMYYDAK